MGRTVQSRKGGRTERREREGDGGEGEEEGEGEVQRAAEGS
jgi:hypothetical protein